MNKYLVGMRGSNKDNWSSSWNFPATSWMDFSEEEIKDDGENPEENIIAEVGHGMFLLVWSFVWHVFMNLILGSGWSSRRHDGGLRTKGFGVLSVVCGGFLCGSSIRDGGCWWFGSNR